MAPRATIDQLVRTKRPSVRMGPITTSSLAQMSVAVGPNEGYVPLESAAIGDLAVGEGDIPIPTPTPTSYGVSTVLHLYPRNLYLTILLTSQKVILGLMRPNLGRLRKCLKSRF
ncbi:hypothetical protein Nepgr_017841 [Nepenthes gracilis]|uniref:Uncharacterized protein n=1 Tax=Nepenthes gracilis TaxID=150966 RepID=A0AAD3SS70_NEPGR|nr:hypothetical protein Nepgr_017841 [Nepenthes gracilis]